MLFRRDRDQARAGGRGQLWVMARIKVHFRGLMKFLSLAIIHHESSPVVGFTVVVAPPGDIENLQNGPFPAASPPNRTPAVFASMVLFRMSRASTDLRRSSSVALDLCMRCT